LTPHGAKIPESILMKLGMVDYFHDNLGGGSATWVVWVNMRLVTSLSFFYLFIYLFIYSLINLFLFLLSVAGIPSTNVDKWCITIAAGDDDESKTATLYINYWTMKRHYVCQYDCT